MQVSLVMLAVACLLLVVGWWHALEALKEKDESITYLRGVAEREAYVDGGERSSLLAELKERTAELEALRPVRAVLGDALQALREARRTVEVPSLFPPGHPRAGESLPWHALAVEVEKRAESLGRVAVSFANGVELVADARGVVKLAAGGRIVPLAPTLRDAQ
jgi:hypothetical protein